MSKQFLLTLGNFNLFCNTNPEIEFSIAKDNRVQAKYSAYDKTKGYDVRGIRAKSNAGVGYIRLSISTVDENGNREYHNGALFVNDKKQTEKQPDFQGSVNLDNKSDGPKLRLSAWKKMGEKAGDYLSISIQEFQNRDAGQPQANKPSGGGFDMSDDASHAENRRAPARQAPPAEKDQAPRRQTAAAGNSFDDMDDNIPFLSGSMHYDMTTSKARKMARYDY